MQTNEVNWTNRMRESIRQWSYYERIWLLTFCAIAVWITVATGDNLFGFTVFLSGVLCVILAAKGNIASYVVGMYNTFGYAWLAWQNGLFGEVSLNLLFFVPMNVVGFLMWRKHMEQGQVRMRRLTSRQMLGVLGGCLAGILILGWALSLIPAQNTPYIDAITNLLSITATILMVLRYREQWLVYIVLNLFTVLMWSIRTYHGSEAGALMIVMWSAYLINAVYGWMVWSRGAGKLREGVISNERTHE